MKKFIEPLTTAVFTTKYIIEEGSPIVYVSHDEDGSWQFHGPENNVAIEAARLVALGEIIELDPSVLEVSEMPTGSKAIRNNKGSKWEIVNSN